MPASVVAEVAGRSISRSMLDRWIAAQAVMDYEVHPTHPAPRGVVPDPPAYATCIAYLAESARQAGTRANPTRAQLKGRCRQSYEALHEEVLNILITFQWVIGESAQRGVRVTDKEVQREYERFNAEKFPKPGEFQRFLEYTGWSEADDKLSLKMDLLYQKLGQKVSAAASSPEAGQRAFGEFIREFTKRWVARTNCRKSDIVSDCRQYKGHTLPEPRV
jgi:hypothetical protein